MSTLSVLDSTLRDGAQAEGISFSLEDKLAAIALLDSLGITFIEAGNPASNPKDAELFVRAGEIKLNHSKLVAFGSTCRNDVLPGKDDALRALLDANTEYISIFGKSWDLHVREVLVVSLLDNLSMISKTVGYLKEQGRKVFFDAEHFFDGYKENPEYAMKTVETAFAAGAEMVCLCDTNGGCFPEEIGDITEKMCRLFGGEKIGIHCHNDLDMAVASTVLAVKAGAQQVQGTLLGIGERCGNACLASVIPNLQLKLGYKCIPSLSPLTAAVRHMAEIANTSVKRNEPFVGSAAFAHKAGMHADGVIKDSKTFEHMNPESVGNQRKFLISEYSGKNAVIRKMQAFIPDIDKNAPVVSDVIQKLKEMEMRGYQFEAAEGSFRLLCSRVMGQFVPSFQLLSYKVLDELPYDAGFSATATVKIKVGGVLKVAAAAGDGPVNALDKALRDALGEFYPALNTVHLIDYKVRVMDTKDATAATVRVLITSTDGADVWTTVGVSSDVIEASWLALVDSIEYKLNLKG